MAGLTPKQAAFITEYLVDLNATQAAIRAGYSAQTAEQQGPRLLGNVGIVAAISEAQKARETRTLVTQDRVVAELSKIAFTNLPDVLGWDGSGNAIITSSEQLSPEARAAVKKFKMTRRRTVEADELWEIETIEAELHPKTTALDMLMKHLGAYPPQKTEHSGPDGGPIAVNVLANLTPEQVAALAARVLEGEE